MKSIMIVASFLAATLSGGNSLAESYVPQMSGSPAAVPQLSADQGSSAYIQQMPEGAKIRVPSAKRRQTQASRSGAAKNTAAVPGKAAARTFPSVGAGAATELVDPTIDNFFPSVGTGTVNRGSRR